MSEYRTDDPMEQAYLTESRELLANVDNDLLAIERQGDGTGDRAANRVFRAAHSVKSGAGFFDLANLHHLAQKIEGVVDLIRSHELAPTPEIVGTLRLGFDKVKDLMRHFRDSNPPDVSELSAALSRLIVEHLPAGDKPLYAARVEVAVPQESPPVEASALDLRRARHSGKSIYLIRYDLMRDIQRRGINPWEIFKRLIDSGTILATVLDLHSAGTLDDPPSNVLPLAVLYASALEPAQVAHLVELPRERLLVVEKNRPLPNVPVA